MLQIGLNNNNYRFNNFKGYDARPLRAVVASEISCDGKLQVAKKLQSILHADNIDFYVSAQERLVKLSEFSLGLKNSGGTYTSRYSGEIFTPSSSNAPISGISEWAQDIVLFTPKNHVIPKDKKCLLFAQHIAQKFGAQTKASEAFSFPAGGNLFFIKNKGREELLLGEDTYKFLKTVISSKDLKEKLGVQDICVLPQGDFHNDLFIRPLNNNVVLVCDDEMTINYMQDTLQKMQRLLAFLQDPEIVTELQTSIRRLKWNISDFLSLSPQQDATSCTSDIVKAFERKNFIPVRVPGRLSGPPDSEDWLTGQTRFMNFLNAVVYQNKNNDLVYICAEPTIENMILETRISDMFKFSFKDLFMKSVAPYIKKENIHFIESEDAFLYRKLKNEAGGLHCMFTEIPEGN